MKKFAYVSLILVSLLNVACTNEIVSAVANVVKPNNSSAPKASSAPLQAPVSPTTPTTLASGLAQNQLGNVVNNSAKLLRWTDAQYQEFTGSCNSGAIKSNPTLATTAINSYCDCTARVLDQFFDYNTLNTAIATGSVTGNDLKNVAQLCANKAGIILNNTASSGSSGSSSNDSNWCNESYENQLVCSGVPAAALPHVPY